MKGEGNQQDYGLRIYDPRIGRFLSLDPLTQDYPELTPYQFAGNDVIRNVDLDGAEPMPATTGKEKEGDSQSTQGVGSIPGGGPGAYGNVVQAWVYHEGGLNGSKAGWMKSEDYSQNVLKPLGDAYNSFWFGKEANSKDLNFYTDFTSSRHGDYDYNAIVRGAAQGIRENPTYDSWAQWIPIWGSAKQAQLDFSVGKYGWGTFNIALAASDFLMVKSIAQAPLKAVMKEGFNEGLTKYLGIDMSHSYSASVSRWRKLGLDVSGYKHHWLFSQELMSEHPWLLKFGNQRWNLTKFSTQASHMRWAHFQTYGGIKYPGARFLYLITSTPTWFKTAGLSLGGRLIQ